MMDDGERDDGTAIAIVDRQKDRRWCGGNAEVQYLAKIEVATRPP